MVVSEEGRKLCWSQGPGVISRQSLTPQMQDFVGSPPHRRERASCGPPSFHSPLLAVSDVSSNDETVGIGRVWDSFEKAVSH